MLIFQIAVGVILAVFLLALLPILQTAAKIKQAPRWKIAVAFILGYLILMVVSKK